MPVFTIRPVYEGKVPKEPIEVTLKLNESPLFLSNGDNFVVLAVSQKPTPEEEAQIREMLAKKVPGLAGAEGIKIEVKEPETH
jgi:hypothetical protein